MISRSVAMSKIPDVEFTYHIPGQQIRVQQLLGANAVSSREAMGLWHVGNSAWKVYRQKNQYASLMDDYARAANDATLPMGSPKFITGKVKASDTGRTTDGFVIATDWMEGSNFLKTDASFRAALTAQSVPHSTTDQSYIKLVFQVVFCRY